MYSGPIVRRSPGTRLGPYELLEPIGAGGMGEVYRARDTRLDRSVAVKVLPAELAERAELRARFEQEAKTISSLNHPNICALYDVGDDYLVMELLEGETLADRIARGPLPTEQLLRIAVEITDALDKAHRRGIIHRDLKPENVMLTKSGAKLLDFGLAKGTGAFADGENHATVAKALTAEGTILGTFQYMAPEQLEGRAADARSDLFALGALLYEMATGKRAFEGKSRASLIAAILSSQPQPISQLRPMTPPALDRLVQTCLAKDPDDRRQTAHDVVLELRFISESGSAAGVPVPVAHRRMWRERSAWGVAAIAVIAAVALAFAIARMRGGARTGDLVQFAIETPPNTALYPFDTKGMAISPDGTMIAFVAGDLAGKQMLYVRHLASTKVDALAGTEDAAYPFWSPDSRQIGFFGNHKLNRIDARGGPIETICDAASGRGGTWNRDGVIVFAPTIASALFRVPSSGGQPVSITKGTGKHRFPWFLPDGKRLIYVAGNDLVAGSLDGAPPTTLLTGVSNAVFAAPDRLIFSRGPLLMSQRFDPSSLKVSGEAELLPFGNVAYMSAKRLSIISASENGTLAFLPPAESESRLVWVDPQGHETGEAAETGAYEDAALSPDGKKIAVVRPAAGGGDIWLIDTANGQPSRFTFQPGEYGYACWSRDSKKLAFTKTFDGAGQVCIKSIDGAERIPVLRTQSWQLPYSFSPDGQTLLTFAQRVDSGYDIDAMSLGATPALTKFLATPFNETSAIFSPDGKWVAYDSDASLRKEVYVRRYPPTNEQWQISTSGGESPRWSADGRELYYVAADTIMHVPIGGGASWKAGAPAPLFRIPGHRTAPRFSGSAPQQVISGISTDQHRFLFRFGTDKAQPSINVVLNWQKAIQNP